MSIIEGACKSPKMIAAGISLASWQNKVFKESITNCHNSHSLWSDLISGKLGDMTEEWYGWRRDWYDSSVYLYWPWFWYCSWSKYKTQRWVYGGNCTTNNLNLSLWVPLLLPHINNTEEMGHLSNKRKVLSVAVTVNKSYERTQREYYGICSSNDYNSTIHKYKEG